MYNKDVENIAKLYLEFTINEPSDDDQFLKEIKFAKEIEAILMKTILGKEFPFMFIGETPTTDGEVEALTVTGQPLKDYQVTNIAYAIANGTIGHEADSEKHEQYAQYVSEKLLALLTKKLPNDANTEGGGKLTHDYYKSSFDPNALSNPSKKSKRFEGDNEGGVL